MPAAGRVEAWKQAGSEHTGKLRLSGNGPQAHKGEGATVKANKENTQKQTERMEIQDKASVDGEKLREANRRKSNR